MQSNFMKDDPAHKESVRKFFTETSEEYANFFLTKKAGKNFNFLKRLFLATEATRGISGRMLDCATGSGEITAAIVGQGNFEQATLLDLSPKMLELTGNRIKKNATGENGTRIELVCEDVFRFAGEHTERKYDLIVCLGLIAHTGRLPELLKLLRAMLAKRGVILLQSTLLDHPGTRVERQFSKEAYYRKLGYRISYFRHQDIVDAVTEAGLRVMARKLYALGLPFGDRVWGWGNYQLERIFQEWGKTHGSEAIYILKADDTH
jgi:cyclopropane fatty-acyl-phospholipid synthase-like methyltransferase